MSESKFFENQADEKERLKILKDDIIDTIENLKDLEENIRKMTEELKKLWAMALNHRATPQEVERKFYATD